MQSERYADFRAKWQASRRAQTLATTKKHLLKVAEAIVVKPEEDEPLVRAHLTREQFDEIRAAVLTGMQVYANADPVNSRRFKILRDAWTELAQVQGKARFVIEVERE